MPRDNRDYTTRTSTGLVPGLIVAGLGVLFLLSNLHIVEVYNWWLFWPVILIAIGATKLIDSPRPNEKWSGAIMLAIGGVFLANNLGYLSWRIWDFWPVILIIVGVLMLINRTGDMPAHFRLPAHKGCKADAVAIFGGFKRQISSDDYRGANYVAIFGGGEIDLRRAQIQSEAAVIEVTCIFGGFELKVPANWIVVNEVTGIFGGTGDETHQPSPDAPGVKRLIVRGVAVFGGVGIKN